MAGRENSPEFSDDEGSIAMDHAVRTGNLIELTRLCAVAGDEDALFATALPLLRSLAGGDAVAVIQVLPDSAVARHADGLLLPPVQLEPAGPVVPVPAEWEALGVVRVAARPLSGPGLVLALAWASSPFAEVGSPELEAAMQLLALAQARHRVAAEFADLTRRVDNAQQLASMGDYDWHIPTDTNRWSDQLFRIYGYEPQSFNASYERFLSFLHPEDRDRIQAVHQQAYASGEPYQMIERIVRPDGQLRYLSSNGEVILGEDGAPVRMRGTCIDVTAQVVAEQERERTATRLGEFHERRRQALEINDNVVQGLSSAVYALEADQTARAAELVGRTLQAARDMMDDLLEPSGQQLAPGDLVRSRSASLDGAPDPATGAAPGDGPVQRILIVDDAEDIRTLLRLKLGTQGRYDVVGEAVDGLDAVDQAKALQPNLVLLDMAMPRMDGLQALPLIRDAVPDVRVIVLSGFNQSTLEAEALAAGADRYVVKGGPMSELLEVIATVLNAA